MRVAWALLLAASAAMAADAREISRPSKEERLEYIRRAQMFTPTDVSAQDLYDGPKGKPTFAVDEHVTCDFFPKPMTGLTEKFLCKLPDGRIFKVKYNASKRFKEAYSEVLGTRLYSALGFYTDKMYPVRVTCRNCPKNPWKYVREKKAKRFLDAEGSIGELPAEAEVGTYTFDPAAIEEKLDVSTIETKKNQGWSWKALEHVDAGAGGATPAELDALRLLTAFVQDSDNKAKQNSLACPRDEIIQHAGHTTCRRPILYIDDLGCVFGRGGFVTGYNGRMDYKGWKKRKVWRNEQTCKARLIGIGGIFRRSTLRDPKIGEGGRALLAHQLAQLSDAQIRDLFRAARIDRMHQMIDDGDHGRREVSLDDWVQLFKEKRDAITHHPGCPQ